jgi:hypothetical protein
MEGMGFLFVLLAAMTGRLLFTFRHRVIFKDD